VPRVYSVKSSTLQPYTIPDDTLLAMGRLIRACAELEDIFTMYLCRLAKLGEGQVAILLGVTPVSKKIALAGQFARAKGGVEGQKYTQLVENDTFKEIWRARNIAAHGVLLGLSDDGLVTFRTMATDGMDADSVRIEAVGLVPHHFQKVAEVAEQTVTDLESYLGVRSARETRRQQPLAPHTKAQPTRPPSTNRS
jgi:hypothetical protein